MSIPLTTRKNIRDNEPILKENQERITKALGKELEFEADWNTTVAQLADEKMKEKVGELYQKDVMKLVADNIEKISKNELVKEALVEATSANKIIVRVNEKISPKWWVISFENGALVVEHRKAISNLYEIGNFDIVSIIPVPGLPLPARLNLEQHRPDLEAFLEKIGTLTGVADWTLEIDFDKVLPLLPPANKLKVGELYYNNVMKSLVDNLSRTLKNETTKESFNEATSEHKITVEVDDKQQGYWRIGFANGSLVISHKKSISNIYELGNFVLEEVIPSPGLPLVVRLDIEKYKTSLEELLERINKATGVSDWSVEVDFEKVLPQLQPAQQKTVGELYHKSALTPLAQNFEKALAKETVREAFNEATSQHKIIFQVNDKLKGSWEIEFNNGAVVVSHKKSVSNLYELGNLDLVERIPSPGLPLATRINIEDNKAILEEYLEKIKTITGEEWAFEADYEKAIKANPALLKTVGTVYCKDIIHQVTQNLQKALANELTKEAFNEATSERKLIVRVSENPKETKYWNLFFENGALVVQHKKDISNLYEIGNFSLEAVLPVPGVMSLLARLNIQKNQEFLQEYLEIIKTATGEEWSVDEASLEAVYTALKEPSAQTRIGDTFLKDVMKQLAENIKKAVADDMVKEAFNEAATARQIVFRPNVDPKANKYWDIKFDNGSLVLLFKPSISNLYEIGNFKIDTLL